MPKHTPGPWRWRKSPEGQYPEGVRLIAPHSGQLVVMDFVRLGMQGAEPRFSDRNGERRGGIMHRASAIDVHAHPDARLIEAAPDLLRQLVLALRAIESGALIHPESSRAMAIRAAIAATEVK